MEYTSFVFPILENVRCASLGGGRSWGYSQKKEKHKIINFDVDNPSFRHKINKATDRDKGKTRYIS